MTMDWVTSSYGSIADPVERGNWKGDCGDLLGVCNGWTLIDRDDVIARFASLGVNSGGCIIPGSDISQL
jgi:hypothetical protein